MLLIYSPKTSPRLYYTTNLLFRDILELDYELTQDLTRFISYDGPKINYGPKQIGDEIFIAAHPILFEPDIHVQRLESVDYKNTTCIFSSHKSASLPYDPFAASFFLVTRYEEYITFRGDTFGRYRGEKSTAYTKNFLNQPVVNYYAIHIRELLEEKYPQLVFPAKNYQFILTYDIDIAYSMIEKGFMRTQGAMLKALATGDRDFLKRRQRVMSGMEADPYDTFDDQFRLSDTYQVYPIYFFHLGDYGNIDKSIPWNSVKYQALIKRISAKFLTGLHPSFASNHKFKTLEMEIDRLNSITAKPTVRSRQHYILLEFPTTYRTLAEIGVQEDYSMGYPNLLGFRAGICTPFYFYDIEREEPTGLKIFPFCAMDSTLFHEMGLKAETALDEVKNYIDEVRKVSGTFIFVAHNNLISHTSEFKGWRNHFEELIQYAKE